LYQNKKASEQKAVATVKKVEEEKPIHMTLRGAFDFAIQLKEKMVTASTKRGYESKVNKFLEWMAINQSAIKTIDQLTKAHIIEFLNYVLNNTSARNRNNYRVDLGSLFQTLEDNEKVTFNFIKKIAVLKTKPERNKTYTNEVQENIFKHLEETDPLLLLYIKFISYNFLRPIEVNRLKIEDINLKNKTIQFKAKNSPLKTKIIPDLLLQDLPDISKMKPQHYLFTPEQFGGAWETTEDNKRDYFSKRFKKVVKDHFNLGKDYGLYSFRHTYITKLYRELRKLTSPHEAKSRLMLITGHTSMTALEKYLRDIDAELPTDYSAMLTSKN
jgi:integrase